MFYPANPGSERTWAEVLEAHLSIHHLILRILILTMIHDESHGSERKEEHPLNSPQGESKIRICLKR